MAFLANRTKTKGHIHDLWKIIYFALQKSFSAALLAISLIVVTVNQSSISSVVMEVSGKVLEIGAILYKSVSGGAGFISDRISHFNTLEKENIKLKIRLSQLESKYNDNQSLIKENDELKKIIGLQIRSEMPFKVAKLLSISYSPFAKKAVINVGSDDSVEVNDVVSSALGLIGRVTEVSSHYSQVSLIEDSSSRIPIITSKTQVRGVLAYQDQGLKIMYLDNGSLPEIGELVYTSGDGKIFPDGIKIGTVKKIDLSGVYVEKIELLNTSNFVYVTRLGDNFEDQDLKDEYQDPEKL